MIHIRESTWETNSSTMNQITISPDPVSQYYLGPKKVILHTWLPYTEGDIVNSTIEKINIIWCLLVELECNWRQQTEPDWDAEECPYTCEYTHFSQELIETISENIGRMKELFNDAITKKGIQLYRETTDEWNDFLDNFGLEGITDRFFDLFKNEDTLARFIFNKNSFFIFGVEPPISSQPEFGDYGIKLGEDYISIMI